MMTTHGIERKWVWVLLSSTALFGPPVWSPPYSIARAAVPLHEHYPVNALTIDDVRGTDRDRKRSLQQVEQGPMSRFTSMSCFSTEPHTQVPELTPLVPPDALCSGLLTVANDIGWPGYEALGDHARSVGHWSEAERAYAAASELLERTAVTDDHQGLAALLNKLGSTRYTQQDFAGAEVAHRHALRIYSATRAADDLRVADTLHVLAMALFQQQSGRDLAGALFFRAWVVREKVLGPKDPAVAESLHFLALSLYRNDLEKAVSVLLESLDIREKAYGHVHPSVADTLTAMAVLYEAHHRQDLAIPLYQEAMTIRERVFGPNAGETRQVRNSLEKAHREHDRSNDTRKGEE